MKFPIPESALTQHIAVLGMTGSGKSSTEKLIIEHVVPDGARVCVLDTLKSDWWGITSSASGKSPGLPFKILGGPRGHLPLHSSAGKAIGQLVGSGKLPLSIIDMADFEAGGIQRFFVDFAQSLWKNSRGVVYLVIEEAHEIAPKERAGFNQENMAIHWAKKLATGSRTKGIRLVVATQRVQSLHNAVLGSCGTLIAHRVMFDADQEPIIKWIKGTKKDAAGEIAATLSSLPDGTGWLCSGREQIFERIAFPKFKTFDNTATPTGDEADVDIKTAAVDQDELRAIIGDAVKEAIANDPAELKKRIRELERQVAAKPVATIDDAEVRQREQEAWQDGCATGKQDALKHAATVMLTIGDDIAQMFQRAITETNVEAGKVTKPPHSALSRPVHQHLKSLAASADARPARPKPVLQKSHTNGAGEPMSKAERRALTALAQYPDGRTKNQVAILTGYAVTGGGFNNALSALRTKGRIESNGDQLRITQDGVDALGSFEPLPHGDVLLQHWLGQLGKAERAALEVLAGVHPDALTKEDLAVRAGYEASGGGFNNALSRLRTLELISGRGELRASEDLF